MSTQTPANVRPTVPATLYESARNLESTCANALDRYRAAGCDLERLAALWSAKACGRYPVLRAELDSLWRRMAALVPHTAIRDLKPGDRFLALSGRRVYEVRERTDGGAIVTQYGPIRFSQGRVVYYEPGTEPEPVEPPEATHPAATLEEQRTALQRQLERARREADKVADQLAWALDTGKPDEHVDQIEERLDGRRAVTHQIMHEMRAVDAALVARADRAFADAHPDLVFDEVLRAGNSLEVLKKRADGIEQRLREREDMPTEREWRAVRAAIEMVSRCPEWVEARQDDAHAVEAFEHSVSTWRREPTRVGLMSLAEVA